MRRHIATLLGPIAGSSVLVLWLAAAPMAAAGGPCHDPNNKPDSTTETTTQVKLMPCAFAPTVTQVATGSTVTFVNGPELTHLITGANEKWGSGDVEVGPGNTVTYTFAKAGLYPYACAIHAGMSGVIVVGAVATAAAGGTAAGTTTGTTGTGSGAAPASTTASSSSPIESVPLVVGSALAGAVVGASVIWLSTRRRASTEEKAAGIA